MSASVKLEQPSWPPSRLKAVYVWYALLALIGLGILAFAIFQPIQVLPRISLAPGFALVDQDGQRLTNEDLRGSFVLYTFSHTDCEAPCPDTGPSMREIQQAVAGLDTGGIPVRFVTIAFDGERATPEQLQAYAERVGAEAGSWRIVSGDPERLKQVIGGGFSTYYARNEDGSFDFDPAFALVDGWGILRARYKTGAPDPDILARDLTLLAKEVRNSKGANRLAYEAAHLFLCYPD